MFTGTLLPGLTTRDRSWAYIEGTSPEDGTLAVSETTGKRVVKEIVRKYGVEEQAPLGFPGRVFLLAKLVHTGDSETVAGKAGVARTGEVYQCSVSPDPRRSRCTCTAGATAAHRPAGDRVQKVPCVHLEALAGLIAAGLDEAFAPLPARVTTFETSSF